MVLLEFCKSPRRRGRKVLPWKMWEWECTAFLSVNAVAFFLFALLGHQPAYLVQILTLLSMSCWVACWCSIAAWAWRKGVKAEGVDPPLMMLLLRLPRWKMLFAWLLMFSA